MKNLGLNNNKYTSKLSYQLVNVQEKTEVGSASLYHSLLEPWS